MDENDRLIPEDHAMELLRWKRSKLRRQVELYDIPHQRKGKERYYPLAPITRLAHITKQEFLNGVALPERVEWLTLRVREQNRLLRNLAQTLGFAHVFWQPSDQTLAGLYTKAFSMINKYGDARVPKAHTVNRWLGVVARLTAQEFHSMNRLYKADPHPWRPFWTVSNQMRHALKTHHSIPIQEENVILAHRISLAIDALERAVMVYIGVISPNADFHRVMLDALQYPDMRIQDVELQQLVADEEGIGDPQKSADELIDED